MSKLALNIPDSNSRFARNRSLYLLIAALIIMVAVWSWLALDAPKQITLDQHVHNIASQLRCPVCQDESVADAPSTVAQQMRTVIREQIQEGKSDQDIIQYFLSRYGSQNIGWSPPWQGFSILAWVVPILLMVSGVGLLWLVVRDWQFVALASARSSQATSSSPESSSNTVERSPEDLTLERYRKQLEQELAAEDPLFRRYAREAE